MLGTNNVEFRFYGLSLSSLKPMDKEILQGEALRGGPDLILTDSWASYDGEELEEGIRSAMPT